MGGSDSDAQLSKGTKSSTAHERPLVTSSSPTPAVYPDWPGFQGYCPIPPHGFFHSPMAASPPAHPYIWGSQHVMPPFGAPPFPYVMYPHGVYVHPSMAAGSHSFSPYAVAPNGSAETYASVPGSTEDVKSSEGKEKKPMNRSKGSLGSLNMITGEAHNEMDKTPGTSNGHFSESDGSRTEGSSNGSDANSQNDERETKRQRRKQSNRESARRSRLRKQAESEELACRVQVLQEENSTLQAEVDRIKNDREQLLTQNASLKERLGEHVERKEDTPGVNRQQHSSDTLHNSFNPQAAKSDDGKSGL